jgi:hypothetical protein
MVMDTQEVLRNIERVYIKIREAVGQKLIAQGYHSVEEKHHPEAFGSRYIIWTNETDTIRLIWDGRDDWFLLEKTNDSPLTFNDSWHILIHKPYNPRVHDIIYVQQITGEITDALEF